MLLNGWVEDKVNNSTPSNIGKATKKEKIAPMEKWAENSKDTPQTDSYFERAKEKKLAGWMYFSII